MDLPELYAEFCARGMEPHPRLSYGGHDGYWIIEGEPGHEIDQRDARSILTCWALEWFGEQIAAGHIGAYDLINPHYGGKDILDAIEQATRHLAKVEPA